MADRSPLDHRLDVRFLDVKLPFDPRVSQSRLLGMKRLSFTVLVPGGTADTVREGTVVDLLLSVPYLLSDRILPPLHVLNEILATGEIAAGMSGGCRWQPLAVTPQEFEELVLILSERVDGPAVKYVEPPAWVGTLEEWRHWTSEYCYGIPAQRNLEFSRRLRALDDVRKGSPIRQAAVRYVFPAA